MFYTKEDFKAFEEQYLACTEFDTEDHSVNTEENCYVLYKCIYGTFGDAIPVAMMFAPIHETAPMMVESLCEAPKGPFDEWGCMSKEERTKLLAAEEDKWQQEHEIDEMELIREEYMAEHPEDIYCIGWNPREDLIGDLPF